MASKKLDIKVSGLQLLAGMISGRITDIQTVEPDEKDLKKSMTFRLEPAMYATIESYRKKLNCSRTNLVEILLRNSISRIEEQIALDGQMELPVVEKPAKAKAGKK